MSDDRSPVVFESPPGPDLVPGMVTVVEDAGPAPAPAGRSQAQPGLGGFDLALRGYDRHQVDGHLTRVSLAVDNLRAELSASLAREAELGDELARVRAELDRGRPTFDALGDRVGSMLALAESEADQLRTDADHDATALRRAAEREAADIRSDARRDAEELGAAARREVAELSDRRLELLTEIAGMRGRLDAILASTPEQWPSLAPTGTPEAEAAPADVAIDLTEPVTVDAATDQPDE